MGLLQGRVWKLGPPGDVLTWDREDSKAQDTQNEDLERLQAGTPGVKRSYRCAGTRERRKQEGTERH